MTRGYVHSFDARRGTGFVQQAHGADRIPFTLRDSTAARVLRAGDPVEFAVVGGKVGVIARELRPLGQPR